MINEIIKKYRKYGWILEPDAKLILREYNIEVPDFIYTDSFEEALTFFKAHSPVVVKIVSPEIIHKSDVNGVVVGVENRNDFENAFDNLSKLKGFKGVLVEEMVKGKELIVGAKNDFQFGPVILAGMGGIGVEIYKDNSIRMAPINERDADNMLKSLKCYPILKGFRGDKGINIDKLKDFLIKFSNIIMDFKEFFESIDLNPVICSDKFCIVADARIILKN